MNCYVTTVDGTHHTLHNCLEWQFDYGMGMPCDSFRVVCLWDGRNLNALEWVEFTATEGDKTVFRGRVDECECSWSAAGMVYEVSGRGMAALLLDNEAIGRDYETATTKDILKDHVTCFGVTVGDCGEFTPVTPFMVGTGASAWSVMYDFFCYYGGVQPYFDLEGRLQLAGRVDGTPIVVGDTTAVTSMVCRDRRYGVLTQIFLRNTKSQGVMTMENFPYYDMGGKCRRVVNLPDDNFHRSARYSGAFHMEKSNGNLFRLEVEIAQGFFAFPGDLVTVQRTGWGRNGTYRVVESQVRLSNKGFVTRLELANPDILM